MTQATLLGGAIAGLCLATVAPMARAEPGSVQPLARAAYRVETLTGPETMTLPQGLTVLRAKREKFRYGVRVDETVFPRDRAVAWTHAFCARFDRTAARHSIAGGGVTGRNLKFNCQ